MGEPADGADPLRASHILDFLPQVVVVLDAQGVVTYASGLLPDYVKLTAQELIGRAIWEFVHPEDVVDAARSLEWTQATDSELYGPFVVRYFDREGEVRACEALVVNRIEDPAIGGTIVLLRDVVGPQAIERALECLAEGADLQEIVGHLLRAVEQAPIMGLGWVVQHGLDGRSVVIATSPAAASLREVGSRLGEWADDPDADAPVDHPDLTRIHPPLRTALEATANVIRTLRRYASLLAITGERLRLHAALHHAAAHDALTRPAMQCSSK